MELTPDVNPRLVIELTDQSREDLAWLIKVTQSSKTALGNQAIHLLREAKENLGSKGSVTFEYPDGRVERLRLL